MSRSLKVRSECIERVRLAVKRNGFPNQRTLSEEVGLALATVSNFLTGKSVDYATFVEICQRLGLEWREVADLGILLPSQPLSVQSEPDSNPKDFPSGGNVEAIGLRLAPSPNSHHRQDWGEAVDVSVFFGRTAELETLQQWIVGDSPKGDNCAVPNGPASLTRCRLVMLLGMGGIGKTSLAVKLAEQVQDEFEYLIWRSLRNAPPVQELLADVIRFLSNQQEIDLPETIDGKVSRLLEHLRSSRCLLILDNAESILCSDERAGAYRAGYEGYEQLLGCVGDTRHQSCLVLTSREKPRGLSSKEGKNLPIRSLRLTGLEQAEVQEILKEKDLLVSEAEGRVLVEHYAGNPLALKIVATTIQELFDGDVAQFLEQGTVVFGDVSNLLDQQFNRLSALEQQVMYWLAINREWVGLSELREDFIPPAPQRVLLEALESLQQRSLIEKATPALTEKKLASFTQQPVVMEYVTDKLIEQVCEELFRHEIILFNSHALGKAQTTDYVRNAQNRLILKPIADKLLALLGSQEEVKHRLERVLQTLQAQSSQKPGYAAGNFIKLFEQLGVNLSGYDFSSLTIWQVYLQGVNLRRVNFTYADLTKSIFTQTLGDILSVTFSPDGKVLATGIDTKIFLWQISDSKQFATFEGHTAWVMSVTFSPDGQILASGSNDQTIKLWNIQTGQCIRTLRGHTSQVQSITFSPDGQILASGSNDQTIKLWNIHTGQCIRTLQGHDNRVLSVIFSPDNRTLISSSDDETLRIWDTQSSECLRILKTHVNWVLSMALSPDGQILATGSDGRTVKFWNIHTGEYVGSLSGYETQVWAVAFSPNGQLLATGSEDKTARLWDINTGQCLKTFQEHTHQVWLVNFSPDGQVLVSSGDDQTVKLWDIQSGQCLKTLESYSNWVSSVAFNPVSQTLASSSKDRMVRLWNLESGECFRVLQGHADVVTSVTFNSTGEILASASDDQTVRIWDASTGESLRTIWGHTGWIQSISFSPDGQMLASGSYDKTVKLWDVRSGECLQTLEGHTHRVKSVAFSPQGTMLASGSDDQTAKLWEVGTGKCLQDFRGHADWVLCVAFSPCESLLASSSGDQTIKLWDIQSGECLLTLRGHTHRVRSVVFSPDGAILASGSEDHTVKLWDVRTGQCLKTLQGHSKIVWSVTFNGDSQILASCSEDGTIKIWDVGRMSSLLQDELCQGSERVSEGCLKTLRVALPYEGMNITGAIGLTTAQRATLKALGAVELE